MLGCIERVHVIACGVLALDLKAVAEKLTPLKVSLQGLPGRRVLKDGYWFLDFDVREPQAAPEEIA
jgi:hypothetical protein